MKMLALMIALSCLTVTARGQLEPAGQESKSPAAAAQALDATPAWTDLARPEGAIAVYLSPGDGQDFNTGTEASPLQSWGAAYSKVRDGQADQVLIKCGSTMKLTAPIVLNKGCSTPGQYTVVGSYGKGPRPKLEFVNCAGLRADPGGKRGLAFVGLEVVGDNTVDTSGIMALGWKDILIEDCLVRGFRDNIVIQGLEGRTAGLKVRFTLSLDAEFDGAARDGRSQGIYFDNCDDWLIEGCTFDSNGIEGSMFSHNVYCHQSNGPGVFRNNITARSPSEGIQQRSGGSMVNNLALANSYDLYFGGPGNVDFNVCLDSKNINVIDKRGTGILADGQTSGRGNVIGYNRGGTGLGSVRGIELRGVTGTWQDNFVWDWQDAEHDEAQCFFAKNGGSVQFLNNTAVQPTRGWCFEAEPGSAIRGEGNKHWFAGKNSRDMSAKAGSTKLAALPPNPRFNIPDYMTSIGEAPGTVEGFMAKVRAQSRQTWDDRFYGPTVTSWVRSRVGVVGPTHP